MKALPLSGRKNILIHHKKDTGIGNICREIGSISL